MLNDVATWEKADSQKTPQDALFLRDYLCGICDEPGIIEHIGYADTPVTTELAVTRDDVFGLQRLLRKAEVVLWKLDLWNAAMNGAEMFLESTCEGRWVNEWSPGKSQLWVFSPAYMLHDLWIERLNLNGSEGDFDVVAMLVYQRNSKTRTGVCKIMMHNSKDGDVEMLNGLTRNEQFHRVAPEFRFDMSWEAAAGIEFMGTKIAKMVPHVWPRPMRRRAMKAGTVIPEVNVVSLRRTESGNLPSVNTSTDWQHQWIVGGHWRNQWYSRSEEHKPVYVSPYVKGPEGKPLLQPRQTIYKVDR